MANVSSTTRDRRKVAAGAALPREQLCCRRPFQKKRITMALTNDLFNSYRTHSHINPSQHLFFINFSFIASRTVGES